MKTLLILPFLMSVPFSHASVTIDMSNYQTQVRADGQTNSGPIYYGGSAGVGCSLRNNSAATGDVSSFLCFSVSYTGVKNGTHQTNYYLYGDRKRPNCPPSLLAYYNTPNPTDPVGARVEWQNFVNSRLPTIAPLIEKAEVANLTLEKMDAYAFQFACKDPRNKYGTADAIYTWLYGSELIITNPPIDEVAKCTISNDITLSFLSDSVYVSGLTQNGTLNISCSQGKKTDYRLKLTSSQVQDGRMAFGNGVLARISLNGIPVDTNGAGIVLKQLDSGSIPVSANLEGMSSNSGVFNANGVLLLEAL